MNGDIIEIKIFDKDHTKYFQATARINDKKAREMMNDMLKTKGIMIVFKKPNEDIDFF